MKNETGGSQLVYDDGTPFMDFGGPGITMNENATCMYDQTSRWNDGECYITKEIICQFDCDNVNDS